MIFFFRFAHRLKKIYATMYPPRTIVTNMYVAYACVHRNLCQLLFVDSMFMIYKFDYGLFSTSSGSSRNYQLQSFIKSSSMLWLLCPIYIHAILANYTYLVAIYFWAYPLQRHWRSVPIWGIPVCHFRTSQKPPLTDIEFPNVSDRDRLDVAHG